MPQIRATCRCPSDDRNQHASAPWCGDATCTWRPWQYDEAHNRVDLNPPGRRQNKKHRPVLAVTPTLKPWLQIAREPTKRYVAYGGKPIKSITSAWSLLVTEAGLDERVTPYSIRHGMAREMRKRKVPKEQISIFWAISLQAIQMPPPCPIYATLRLSGILFGGGCRDRGRHEGGPKASQTGKY